MAYGNFKNAAEWVKDLRKELNKLQTALTKSKIPNEIKVEIVEKTAERIEQVENFDSIAKAGPVTRDERRTFLYLLSELITEGDEGIKIGGRNTYLLGLSEKDQNKILLILKNLSNIAAHLDTELSRFS